MNMNFFIIIYKSIFRGGGKIRQWFFQKYAQAYFKSRGAILESPSHFYGKTLLNFDKKSNVNIGTNFICRSGKTNQIDNSSTSKLVCGPDVKLSIGDILVLLIPIFMQWRVYQLVIMLI